MSSNDPTFVPTTDSMLRKSLMFILPFQDGNVDTMATEKEGEGNRFRLAMQCWCNYGGR